MFDYIEGKIEYIEADSIVVGTLQGVGYRIFCPNPYAFQIGETNRVFTHHHVREDAAHLYGFHHREQRNLFRKLLDVSGIGPKGALAILAAAEPMQVVAAIQREDLVFLTKFPGIGKKTAGRLVLDLKDKLSDFTRRVPLPTREKEDQLFAFEGEAIEEEQTAHEEASEALKALGYSDLEVSKVMKKLSNEVATTEQLIKKALQLFISVK